MATRELGLFPLGAALVPGELMPLHIFEARYKDLIADCLEHGNEFVLIYADEEGTRELGCTAAVTEVLERFDDGRLNIVITGGEVVRLIETHQSRSYLTGEVEPAHDEPDDTELLGPTAMAFYNRIVELTGADVETDIDPGSLPLSYAIVARVEIPAEDKQRILELRSEKERLTAVVDLLRRGVDRLTEVAALQQVAQTNGKSSLHR